MMERGSCDCVIPRLDCIYRTVDVKIFCFGRSSLESS